MKKKLSISVNYTPDYSILGIISPLSDFKLVWNLNNILKLSLKKIESFTYSSDKKKINEPFSLFYYENEALETDFFLISNKSADSFLIPEYSKFDYLFLLRCCDSKRQMSNILCNMNSIENVQTVFQIDPNTIKHIHHFFSDLELHLMEEEN